MATSSNSDRSSASSDANDRPLPFGQAVAVFFWRMIPWAALLAFLALLATGGYLLVAAKQARLAKEREAAAGAYEEPAVNVLVWPVTPRTLIDDTRLPGLVRAWESLVIQAQVSGRITAILVKEGQEVAADEVIARIDDRDYRANKKQAEAALTLARESLRRTRELRGEGAATQAELDQAVANMQKAEAALTLADLQLERCSITAPFGGVINDHFIEPGALVSPGKRIAELLDIRRVKVVVGIPENDVDSVRDLETVDVAFAALGGRVLAGRRIFLSASPTEGAQVFELHLEVENEDGLLRPGMFAEAHVVRGRVRDAVVAPLFAVVPRGRKRYVFVAGEDDLAERREVEFGLLKSYGAAELEGLDDEEHIIVAEVTSGLAPGDRLIVQGHGQLEAGRPVRVMREVDSLTVLVR